MKAIGIAITSHCVTAVRLKTFFGFKRVAAIQTESINWKPFEQVPIGQVTNALKSIHQRLKLNRADVSLCIPNYRFFTHHINLASNNSKKISTDQLNYLFEENLPVDLEKIAVKHSSLKVAKQSSCCLSSGLAVSSVKALLSQMEEANINVSQLSGDLFYIGNLITKKINTDVIAICTWNNLVGIILILKKKIMLARYLSLGCEHTTQTDNLESEESKINRYTSELELMLARIEVDKRNLQILVIGNSSYSVPLQNKVSEIFGLQNNPIPALSSTAILSGRQAAKLSSLPEIFSFAAAWTAVSSSQFGFNFRSGDLASGLYYKKLCKPLILIATMLIALITIVNVRLYNEGSKWHQRSLFYRDQQAQIWRHTFPDMAIPSDVTMRLASEKKQLEGLAGQSTGLPCYVSALDTLRSVLSSIPDYIDLYIKDIRIDQDKVVITGQAKTFTMVENLITALGHLKEFNMQPAQSKRVNEYVVDFTLTGVIVNYNKTTDDRFGKF